MGGTSIAVLRRGLVGLLLAGLVVAGMPVAAAADDGMARVGAVVLDQDAGEAYPYATVIDPDGRFAYLGMHTNPGRVAKVDLETFERVGSIEFGLNQQIAVRSAVMDPGGAYAYFGTSNGWVVKVDLDDFEVDDQVQLASNPSLWAAVIAPDGQHAYVTAGNGLRKVALDTMTEVGSLALPAGGYRAATIDPDGAYAYVGSHQGNPSRVVRVDLDTFEAAGTIEFETGPGEPSLGAVREALVAPDGAAAYFVHAGSGGHRDWLTRVDLADFSWEDTLELDVWNLGSGVVAPDGGHAYFGSMDLPGRIARVDLGAFGNDGVLQLASGFERSFRSAVMDPTGDHAYFAVSQNPARLVKIGLREEPSGVARLSGIDRFATSADIALERFDPDEVDVVFLATGVNFPDALAGGPLAAWNGSPILLASRDAVPPATGQALGVLRPDRVVALGGTGVLSDAVLAAAAQAAGGATTDRLSGTDRFSTAAVIARQVQDPQVVYIATGTNFPDALAGGSAAVAEQAPILLVQRDTVPAPTAAYLSELDDLRRVVILGGTGVVSDQVAAQLATLTGDG